MSHLIMRIKCRQTQQGAKLPQLGTMCHKVETYIVLGIKIAFALLKYFMPSNQLLSTAKVVNIFKTRERTNLLKESEQYTIALLCRWMPQWVTPNYLTAVGFIGSLIIFLGFVAATYNRVLLLVAIAGFAIQWFGDSLDGRIAYYRNIPRKWYGFSLDLIMDWLSTILIGIGFYYYLPQKYEILAFTFVAGYGWAMLLTIIKYKITDNYTIDSGLFGPTELRIILCLLILTEMIWPGSLLIAAVAINIILFIVNCFKFHELLQAGNLRDKAQNAKPKIKHDEPVKIAR